MFLNPGSSISAPITACGDIATGSFLFGPRFRFAKEPTQRSSIAVGTFGDSTISASLTSKLSSGPIASTGARL